MGGGQSARFSLVAILAVLLSAGGIAYMASVSYPDELGIVDARRRQHQETAERIASGVLEEISADLSAASRASEVMSFGSFWVSQTGEVLHPALAPLRSPVDSSLEGLLPQRGFQNRQRYLERGRRYEAQACIGEASPCQPDAAKLRLAGAMFELALGAQDTGAEALLGLARLHRISGQFDLAASRYRELAARFGDRENTEGLPYVLLAEVGLAGVAKTAGAKLRLLRNVLSASYRAPNALLEVIADEVLASLDEMDLQGDERAEREGLRAKKERIEAQTALGLRIAASGTELATSARSELRAKLAPWDPTQTLLYMKVEDGRVFGRVMGESALRDAALAEARRRGLHSALRVGVLNLQSPQAQDESIKRLAEVNLGPLWPHLALVLWEAKPGRDAMSDIVEARRRHRAITGGLIAVLVLGLLATIRGAARERELARLKSDFVSTVSHELKTPLTSIRMFAEMLQEGVAGGDAERERHYQGIIVKESERLGLLIANLLDYSQIERGSRTYKPARHTAHSIVSEAADTFSRFREGEGHELRCRFDSEAEDVCVDADRNVLVQCVLNLLSNAAKYGEGKPIELHLACDKDEGWVRMEVIDRGPGISAQEQQKIFREFYRSPAAVTSAIEGTGLGLALVKRHVEALGGEVAVHSVLGKGATFTIRLPEARA